jgi:hypothetical protein
MSGIEKSIALALASKVTEAKFICVNLRSSAVALSQCIPCLCGEIHFLSSVSLADEANLSDIAKGGDGAKSEGGDGAKSEGGDGAKSALW